MSRDLTVKDRLKETEGQSVNIDYFLFSCWEFESELAHAPDAVPALQRWLDQQDEAAPQPGSWKNRAFDDVFDEALSWYKKTFAELQDKNPIDIGRVSDFVPIAVALAYDLRDIAGATWQNGLPEYTPGESDTEPFWKTVETKLTTQFGPHGTLFLRYLQWAFAKEPTEDIEPGSRPPVGRFAPSLFRPRPGAARSSGGGGRGPSAERGGRRSSTGGRGREPQRGRPRTGDHKERSRRPRTRDDKEQKAIEAALRHEVSEGTAKLRENPDLREVKLTPKNSYQRRLQHQYVEDEGFFSYSSGEGTDRCLSIVREPLDSSKQE